MENNSLVDLNFHPIIFPRSLRGKRQLAQSQVASWTGLVAPLPWGSGSLPTGSALKAAKWGWPTVLELQL